MADKRCPKCGCADVIPDVRIVDRGDSGVPLDLTVAVYRNPKAFVFKQPMYQRLGARVCADCGYTEFYVANPKALLAAAKRARPDA